MLASTPGSENRKWGDDENLSKLLAVAGAAIGATAMTLTVALPASAAPGGRRRHVDYGQSGFLAGRGALANAPVVPLQLRGAVNTSGSINLGGNSAVSPIWTRKGTLTVEHGNPNPATAAQLPDVPGNLHDQHLVQGDRPPEYRRLLGRRGSGHALVVFSAIAPRYTSGSHKGQCNFSQNAQPKPYGAYISFRARGRCTSSTSPPPTRLTSAPPPARRPDLGRRARAGRACAGRNKGSR